MRDFFAILAILAAVVGLGVFRVPDENALVAAGIQAAAEGAVYQARHPVAVSVKGRVVTARGRVETEAERAALLSRLAALDGVEEVVDALVLMPDVSPFVLEITSDDAVRFAGHLPTEAMAARLRALFGADPGLPLATGTPDRAWDGVAERVAEQLALLLQGEMRIEDRQVLLRGQAHLPRTVQQIEAALTGLPEDYTVTLEVTALDDGLPYSLLVERDPLMGQRLSGKLPPDFDLAAFDVLGVAQERDLTQAPLPLDAPGFAGAVTATLPLMATIEAGTLAVSPDMLTLSGGPVSPDIMAEAQALRDLLPDEMTLRLALIPADDGPDLSFTARWDGAALVLSGRVPRDFPLDDVEARFGQPPDAVRLVRGPYPDLDDWDEGIWPGLRALKGLQSGVLEWDGAQLKLVGRAVDPVARRMAVRRAGPGAELKIDLADDGAPAHFTLRYDPAKGGSVLGKLPAGLSMPALAEALHLDALRGRPPVSPEGNGAPVLRALHALEPFLRDMDSLVLDHRNGGTRLEIALTQGSDVDAIADRLAPQMGEVTLALRAAAPALEGTRRFHAILRVPQVFRDGFWFPETAIVPEPQPCAEAMAMARPVPFAPGQFTPDLTAAWPLAALAGVARTCQRLPARVLTIDVEVGASPLPALNRQLARRRAEALRDAFVLRGVDPDRLRIDSRPVAGADRVSYRWD